MWSGDSWYGIYEKMRELSKKGAKKQITMHLDVVEDERTVCGEKKSNVHSTTISSSTWLYRTRSQNRSSDMVPSIRLAHISPPGQRTVQFDKDHAKVTYCGKCLSNLNNYEKELIEKVTNRPAREEKRTAPPDFYNPPKREPGTESMTGHLDEGSQAGPCGEAAIGFKTKFIPWITCQNCLVRLDEFEEAGLLQVTGYYVTG